MRLLLSSLALATLASALEAQSTSGTSPSPPCSRPEHRQFDFWVGEWDVSRPDGAPAGTNRIRAVHGGCALQEEWRGRTGYTGSSLNAFDATTGRWHQTWIGSDGVLLRLDGGMKEGSMELSGSTTGANGTRTLHRIRWTPHGGAPARVRQLWESSTDGGRTWAVVFDGAYTRKG
jgi:hypothetical protein